jgi:hypothetical protein
MSAILIDKGIPIPPASTGMANTKYPWDQMEIGDSFLIPGRMKSNGGVSVPPRLARGGFKVSCRVEGAGVRVWRIA